MDKYQSATAQCFIDSQISCDELGTAAFRIWQRIQAGQSQEAVEILQAVIAAIGGQSTVAANRINAAEIVRQYGREIGMKYADNHLLDVVLSELDSAAHRIEVAMRRAGVADDWTCRICGARNEVEARTCARCDADAAQASVEMRYGG